MDRTESLSHSKWECKYHVVFIPKRRRKTRYGALRKHLGGGVSPAGRSEGESDRGRAPDAGSRAHADLDPPEVRGVAGDRLYQGEERDPFGAGVRGAETEFRGATFLGAGLLRLDGGSGKGVIREYIRQQEEADTRLDQMNLWRC